MRPTQLSRYIDPTIIHRDLEPEHLAQEVDTFKAHYAAMEPRERLLSDAVCVGALRGLQFSRQYLDYISGPADVLLGNGNARPPNAKQGLTTQVVDLTLSTYAVAIAPRLANYVQPGIKACGSFVASRQGMPPQAIAAASDDASKIVTSILVQLPQTIIQSCMLPGTVAAVCASSWIKLAVNTPAALVGAAFGAAQHLTGRGSSAAAPMELMEFGARGARNEETFALLDPISSISEQFFFLSEDKFGFDVRELALLAQSGRPGLNPYTNSRFSDRDLERLVAHPSHLFGDALPTERLNATSLLAPWQWLELVPFFVNVSRALQLPGEEHNDLRKDATQALRNLLQQVDPFSRVEIELFFQGLSGYDVARMMREVDLSEANSYEFGERLYRITQSIGIIQAGFANGPTTQDIIDAAQSMQGAVPHSNIIELIARIKCTWAMSQSTMRAESDHTLLRHPWLRAMMPSQTFYPTAEGMEPIDLSVPTLAPPYERQIYLEALAQGDNGTHDIAAMLRAEIGR